MQNKKYPIRSSVLNLPAVFVNYKIISKEVKYMYCKNCGQQIDDRAYVCPYCKTYTHESYGTSDAPSAGFAVLGFFIPIVGLILYLVYENKQPMRAKSAGKGALIGFIVQVVAAVVTAVIIITGLFAYFWNFSNFFNTYYNTMLFEEQADENILGKYADVTFGEFEITDKEYYYDTSLDVTVKNISDKQYTFVVTVEAVDENGARIENDEIFAYRLNAGQSEILTEFEFIDEDKIYSFKNASFNVLYIQYFEY